ncbi:acyl CoA synthetase [Naegleria gruberi]|uniref:Acyl CoA synthetase n=1 Tax=Naegleria gruberi TaxID=5762 RepID=D2VFE6_NAEGR|nr:acyl CoA synthetase [Naegleria gruberi]EFC44449.1 acyl CoA synthetase [Naegleria gruberi]|eukprot:XP_002677193.1 acyl CoA synthetase [Naegleria gruberi strain NEG-M]
MKELLAYTVKANSTKDCLGVRKAIKKFVEKRDGRDWEIIEFEDVVYENYDQVYSRIMNFAYGLTKFTGLNSKDIFGIFEETRKEWLMALHACFQYNMVVMTCYASLGDDALCCAINETELTALLVNEKSLGKINKSISPNCPTLKYIVYTHSIISDENEKKATSEVISELSKKGIKVLSYEEVEQLGESEKKANNITPVKEEPTLESLALIMYTSGTTNAPKGVLISHKNILSIVTAADQRVGDDPKIKYQYIGYLPLAHILEMAAEHVILKRGGRIGFGNARYLSERTARPKGDIEAIAPTVLVGVPRVFDTIKKGAFEKIKSSSPFVQWMFHSAYNYKLQSLKSGREAPIWNFLVFNKFKKLVGGNLALILCGGAALSKETQEFLRVCMSCSVIQGYGLTETSAGGCIQYGYQPFATKNIGPPVNTAQIKLVSVPDMGYIATGDEPRGEIAIKGNNVTMGYFKQEKLTKESYASDGYFYTGDIGVLHKDGTYSIIDRKKNLTKLATGEYIALERLESVYGNSPFVSPNGIMVYGDSERDYAVALILAQPGHTKHWAQDNGVTGDLNQIIKDPKYQKAVANSLREEAKKNHLNRMEELKNFRVLTDEWTPENEMLTAAMKLKRSNIVNKYKTIIEELYASNH